MSQGTVPADILTSACYTEITLSIAGALLCPDSRESQVNTCISLSAESENRFCLKINRIRTLRPAVGTTNRNQPWGNTKSKKLSIRTVPIDYSGMCTFLLHPTGADLLRSTAKIFAVFVLMKGYFCAIILKRQITKPLTEKYTFLYSCTEFWLRQMFCKKMI